MKVAILGYADQGKSAYVYWRGGNEITICDADDRLTLPEGVGSQLGTDYLRNLSKFDLLIRTPALHPKDILEANEPGILDKIWTNTNEFMKVCPSKNIICVTGTKGKGTTSMLVTKILEAAGKKVHLGGNIGLPPLDMLKNEIKIDDWIVLELANFQLIDIAYSPPIAVCLMVVPEHLNWHEDMQEYVNAKMQLFKHQSDQDVAVYFSENETSQKIASHGNARKIPYYAPPGAHLEEDKIVIEGQVVCRTSDVRLLGKHNLQNVCAAVTTVWQVTQNIQAMREIITSFTGMEHRLEFVREHEGVKYYNDSFGTTPETAIVAIEAFTQPKVVILGGSDKGADFSELAHTVVNSDVRHVVAVGDTAEVILDKIDKLKNTRCVEWTLLSDKPSMAEIVSAAREHAEPGDVILLSTGCASFGLFENYKDRGEQFRQVVKALA